MDASVAAALLRPWNLVSLGPVGSSVCLVGATLLYCTKLDKIIFNLNLPTVPVLLCVAC